MSEPGTHGIPRSINLFLKAIGITLIAEGTGFLWYFALRALGGSYAGNALQRMVESSEMIVAGAVLATLPSLIDLFGRPPGSSHLVGPASNPAGVIGAGFARVDLAVAGFALVGYAFLLCHRLSEAATPVAVTALAAGVALLLVRARVIGASVVLLALLALATGPAERDALVDSLDSLTRALADEHRQANLIPLDGYIAVLAVGAALPGLQELGLFGQRFGRLKGDVVALPRTRPIYVPIVSAALFFLIGLGLYNGIEYAIKFIQYVYA